eukprot:m.128992 g.128992  ORF g.128992 m.128992 type:complete len:117 (+) comp37960_c0_seq14:320-670(+)
MEIVHSWLPRLKAKQVRVVIGGHSGKEPKGVGFAKNRAIQQSSGQFLCFMDADDIMEDRRIEMQYETSVREPDAVNKKLTFDFSLLLTLHFSSWWDATFVGFLQNQRHAILVGQTH